LSGNDLINDSSLASMINVLDVAVVTAVVVNVDDVEDIGSAIATSTVEFSTMTSLNGLSFSLLLLLLLVALLPPRM
jgi:hypothetical protein